MPDAATTAALRILGLAHRAGRAVVGTRAVVEAAAGGELTAVVVARDATDNALDRLSGVLGRADLGAFEGPERGRLGEALGRQRLVVVGVTGAGFAEKLAERLPRHPGPSDEDASDGKSDTLRQVR
ncbi:MAG: L7Ae/L30e/S12e/Gadd45 family ribosomal protein [Gemmatimonadota bacterium]